MDKTIPYEIEYPQCNPPLTKDGADIEHMRRLALSIDAAVQDVADAAGDNWISPDGAAMAFTGATTLNPGNTVPFDTSLFDNTGVMVNLLSDRFDIRQSGIYAASCTVHGNSAPVTNGWLGTRVVVNGVPGTVTGPSTWNSPTNNSGSSSFVIVRLNAGDEVSFQFASDQNYDLLNSRAAIVRLV